jgi:hypothetical protein
MRETIKFRFAGIGIMLVTCTVFGAAVMLLWNALMPQIFAFPQISYLQAAGLLILARLLFGGVGGSLRSHALHRRAGGDGRLFHHGNKLREKWLSMSKEERKEFIEKEKDFFKFHRGFSRFHDFFGGDENTQEGRGNE